MLRRLKRMLIATTLTVLLLGSLLYAAIALTADIPDTPEGWFAHHTGLSLPADTELVEQRGDLLRTFIADAGRCWMFEVDEATIEQWLEQPPPWQESWTHEVLSTPHWYASSPAPEHAVHFTQTEGEREGRLLVIDAEARIVSLHTWPR